MKLAATVVFLLICLPDLSAGERLSDEEVLSRLDEPAALEARWLLNAELFATGSIGFGGRKPRAAIAYRRLLEAKNAVTFETLIRSRHDVAVYYGMAGLLEIEPGKLLSLLPDLALRKGPVLEISGCNGHTSTPITKALEELHRRKLITDQTPVIAAWNTFLDQLPGSVGSWQDHSVVTAFLGILGTIPKREPPSAASQYVSALSSENKENEIRDLAASEGADPVSRRLAFEWLADWEQPSFDYDNLEVVWTRQLDQRAIQNLQIEATYWELLAGGRVVDLRPDIPIRPRPADVLSSADWTWLEQHEDQNVRDATRRLRANTEASWQLGDDFPTDPKAQHQAVRVVAKVIRDSKREDTPQFRRAEKLLLGLLADQPKLLRFVDLMTLTRVFSPNRRTDTRREWFKLAEEDDGELFLLAARFFCVSMEQFPQLTDSMKSDPHFDALIKRLWKAADSDTQDRWECRELLARVLECMKSIRHDEHRKSINAVARWFREYAREYASARTPIPGEGEGNYWLAIASAGDGRPHALIEGIRLGSNDFLPKGELSGIEAGTEGNQLPALQARVREAVAKLD